MFLRILFFCDLVSGWKVIDIRLVMTLIKRLYDYVPFASQGLLNVAIAYERYCFVCRAAEVDVVLTIRWRCIVYTLISVASFIPFGLFITAKVTD